jgi:hypothetical protein
MSEQGRRVLEALATGPLSVAAMLAHIRRPEVAAPVARASLSRTLCGCWVAGFEELVTGHATHPMLTEQAAFRRTAYATVRASPEAAYQVYRRQLARPADDPYESAAAYIDAFRRAAAERPYARVRRVVLTPNGPAAVNLTNNSTRPQTVNK